MRELADDWDATLADREADHCDGRANALESDARDLRARAERMRALARYIRRTDPQGMNKKQVRAADEAAKPTTAN